ncbi:TIGR03619 family F420-dependent LLM class oxidoreductase [Blastococcus sp. SYSU D00820]
MTIGIGLGLPQLGPHVTRGTVQRFCRRAEELGYASLWAQEHLFYPLANSSGYAGRTSTSVHPAYRDILGTTELLAFVAACTERAMIGSSVLVAGYHRPVELAQRLATLDLLSGGRLVAGIAAGWSDEEHAQMDVDPRTRGRRMDELVEALLVCWGEDPVRFSGEFFEIPEAVQRPKPVQRPHPPLLSGLRSEAGLRRTARYFDIWNPSRGTADQLLEQMAAMAAMRPEGRAPLRLFLRSYTQRPTDPVGGGGQGLDGVVEDLRTAIAAGAEQLIVDTSFADDMDSPEAWEQVPDVLAPLLAVAREEGAVLSGAPA